MRLLIVFLLWGSSLLQSATLPPPSQSIKKRNGDTVILAWDFPRGPFVPPDYQGLQFFSIKEAHDLNQTPVQIIQAPATDRQAQVIVRFTKQYPKYVYYVISAVYTGSKGESFLATNSLMVERVGAPP